MENASRVYFFMRPARRAADASDGAALPLPRGFLWHSFLFIFCFPSFGNTRSENESNVSLRLQRNSPLHHFPHSLSFSAIALIRRLERRESAIDFHQRFQRFCISHANRSANKLLKSEPSDSRRWRGTAERALVAPSIATPNKSKSIRIECFRCVPL